MSKPNERITRLFAWDKPAIYRVIPRKELREKDRERRRFVRIDRTLKVYRNPDQTPLQRAMSALFKQLDVATHVGR